MHGRSDIVTKGREGLASPPDGKPETLRVVGQLMNCVQYSTVYFGRPRFLPQCGCAQAGPGPLPALIC
jgi:hypothetical protein